MAEVRNAMPLPAVKPLCGLRLPPDRYCLSACNYKLRAAHHPKRMTKSALDGSAAGGSTGVRTNQRNASKQSSASSASGSGQYQAIPRQTMASSKTQVVTIPKPIIKFTATSKPVLTPQGSDNTSAPILSIRNTINPNSMNVPVPEVKMEVELNTSGTTTIVTDGIEIKTEHRPDEEFHL